MDVKTTKQVHTELAMHSVRFAKDEQGRRKGQDVLFKSLRDLFPAPWGVKYSRERVYS